MFFYKGLICPVCEKDFTAEDDVVSCPDCGAPHHRHCWQETGHCKLKEFHGTPNQWSKESAFEQMEAEKEPQFNQEIFLDATMKNDPEICKNCGAENASYAEFCYKCGQDLDHSNWNSVPFNKVHDLPNDEYYDPEEIKDDFDDKEESPFNSLYGEYAPFSIPLFDTYGGVPKGAKLGDCSAEEVASHVSTNTSYYIPRFMNMETEKKKTSWNWVAFLFTSYWLFYRKNYLTGILVFLFKFVTSFFSLYISYVYVTPQVGEASALEIYKTLYQSESLKALFFVYLGLNIISFLFSLVFGLFGNSLYYIRVKKRIRKIRTKHYGNDEMITTLKPLYRQELLYDGGVSFSTVAIAVGLISFLNFAFFVVMSAT